MKSETAEILILAAIVVALVLATRKPVPRVSTSSTVLLPDGTRVGDELPTIDQTALRNAVDLLLWK
jgi:hypothetical protein